MLANVVVRVVMVTLTLAVVFWIGWSVPGPQAPKPLEAALHTSVPDALEPVTEAAPKTTDAAAGRRQKQAVHPRANTLDVNRATQDDFQQLPGIGPVLAARIVEYRATQGGFEDIEQLRRVKGIGKKKFEQIRPHVAVVKPRVQKPTRKAA